MDLIFFLIVLPLLLRFFVRKNMEERYFRRMYWTMRQAQEDSKRDKDNHK